MKKPWSKIIKNTLRNGITQANAIFVKINIEMGAQLLRRYLWIVEQIRLSERITFSELQCQWSSPLSSIC